MENLFGNFVILIVWGDWFKIFFKDKLFFEIFFVDYIVFVFDDDYFDI